MFKYLTPSVAQIAYEQFAAHHLATASTHFVTDRLTLSAFDVSNLLAGSNICIELLVANGCAAKVTATYTIDMNKLYALSFQTAVPGPRAGVSSHMRAVASSTKPGA